MLDIQALNKAALLAYIHSEHFGQGEDIPISVHRALSHVANPVASEEDVLLLLASEGNELLGYLGILPDFYYPPQESRQKVAWLSCLWVSPAARGRGISNRLIDTASQYYHGWLLAADYVPAIKKIYDKTQFFHPQPFTLAGYRYYILADFARLLAPKHPLLSKYQKGLSWLDRGLNIFLQTRKKWRPQAPKNLLFEYPTHLDEELADLIKQEQQSSSFRRNALGVNWMIQSPWILEKKDKDPLNAKYYFSSTAQYFRNYLLKVRHRDGRLIGFAHFSNREGHLKLLYLYHQDALEEMAAATQYHLFLWPVKTFTCLSPELIKVLPLIPAFYKKEIRRYILAPLTLGQEHWQIASTKLQAGDGDNGFT